MNIHYVHIHSCSYPFIWLTLNRLNRNQYSVVRTQFFSRVRRSNKKNKIRILTTEYSGCKDELFLARQRPLAHRPAVDRGALLRMHQQQQQHLLVSSNKNRLC